MDRAVVAALRQAPQTQAVLAQAQDGLPLLDPLQIADQRKPERSSRSRPTLPTPHRRPTLWGASQAFASSRERKAKPRGLLRSEAIFAKNLQ